MSILERLKRKPLLEELQGKFPQENIQPWGFCVIVPLKLFPKHYEEQLKKQGFRIYYQGYKGQTSAFIVLEKKPQGDSVAEEPSLQKESVQESRAVSKEEPLQEAEDKNATEQKTDTDSGLSPVKSKLPWSLEERKMLQQLLGDKVPIEEISNKLGRSVYSVAAELRHIPDYKPKYPRKSKKKPEENKPATETRREQEPDSTSKEKDAQTSYDDNELKELLEACILLSDSDRKAACKILLNESIRMLESRKRGD